MDTKKQRQLIATVLKTIADVQPKELERVEIEKLIASFDLTPLTIISLRKLGGVFTLIGMKLESNLKHAL